MNESTATPSAGPLVGRARPIPVVRWRYDTRVAVRALVASRVIVWAAGLLAIGHFGVQLGQFAAIDPQHLTEPFRSGLLNELVAPAGRWDSVWYLRIAEHGYSAPMAPAFYPLYPLLIRAGATLFGLPLVVGASISLVSAAVAVVLIYRLSRLDLNESQSRLTVLLIAFFPTALFLSAVYSESLFLALSVGSIYAARRERWAAAGLLGALAAATRPEGVLLVVPLALLWPRDRLRPAAAWIGLVPAGLVAYMLYMAMSGHGLFAPLHAEAVWGRRFAGPLAGIVAAVHGIRGNLMTLQQGIPGQPHDLIDLGFLLFAVLGLAWCYQRLPLAYFAYGVVSLAEAVSYPSGGGEPLLSLSRFVLVIFPVFMGWGARLGDRRRLSWAVLGLSAGLLAVFSGLWATWAWVA
ncbi:MAG TPA: mannosyltransferase family protein [Solirubrobacteraceae bacterium]|nr:mannosyltransferase family protein [Solirubrobacteraceae bacterium]